MNEKRIIPEYDVLRVLTTALVIIGHATYFTVMTKWGGLIIA